MLQQNKTKKKMNKNEGKVDERNKAPQLEMIACGSGAQCHGASGSSSSSLALSMAASRCMVMGLSPVILAGMSMDMTVNTE